MKNNSDWGSEWATEWVSEWIQISDPIIHKTGTQRKTSLSCAKNEKKIKVEKNFRVGDFKNNTALDLRNQASHKEIN